MQLIGFHFYNKILKRLKCLFIRQSLPITMLNISCLKFLLNFERYYVNKITEFCLKIVCKHIDSTDSTTHNQEQRYQTFVVLEGETERFQSMIAKVQTSNTLHKVLNQNLKYLTYICVYTKEGFHVQ